MPGFPSFLGLQNTPLSLCYLCIDRDHIFFIHSCLDGRLGCFRVLAFVNNVQTYILTHISYKLCDIGKFSSAFLKFVFKQIGLITIILMGLLVLNKTLFLLHCVSKRRHSINKSIFSVLFLPLPPAIPPFSPGIYNFPLLCLS